MKQNIIRQKLSVSIISYYEQLHVFFFLQYRNSANGTAEPETVEPSPGGVDQPRTTDSDSESNMETSQPEPDEPSAKRNRVDSGHKVGFHESWIEDHPWLYSVTESDQDGSYVTMMCRLCKRHALPNARKKAWVDYGCRTLRKDKVSNHEGSDLHKFSVKAELLKKHMDTAALNQNSAVQEIVQDAMRVLCYLVQHNLPLDLFESLIELIGSLGAPNIKKMKVGKNATYTSWDSVQSFLISISDEVKRDMIQDVKSSPSYALMADEVCDVTPPSIWQ